MAVLAILWVLGVPLHAQETASDPSFRLGFCGRPPTDSSLWSRLVENPDVPARIRGPVPHPPIDFGDASGNYAGRVVLALMVDADGRVVRGSVSVTQSSDSQLSRWACGIATQLHFAAATLGGKPVLTMVDQPLTYAYGDAAPRSP